MIVVSTVENYTYSIQVQLGVILSSDWSVTCRRSYFRHQLGVARLKPKQNAVVIYAKIMISLNFTFSITHPYVFMNESKTTCKPGARKSQAAQGSSVHGMDDCGTRSNTTLLMNLRHIVENS